MTRPSNPLAGQLALVTGGGSGIGLGCARELVRDGASVVLAARNVERLASAADELRSIASGGAQVHVQACDVTDEDSVASACAAAQAAAPACSSVTSHG